MRRSIDDYPFTDADLPHGADDATLVSWAVAISDDYDDSEPRVVLTVEEIGRLTPLVRQVTHSLTAPGSVGKHDFVVHIQEYRACVAPQPVGELRRGRVGCSIQSGV